MLSFKVLKFYIEFEPLSNNNSQISTIGSFDLTAYYPKATTTKAVLLKITSLIKKSPYRFVRNTRRNISTKFKILKIECFFLNKYM